MTPRVFRLVLRLVPRRWRDSVERDLLEDATRAGRSGVIGTAWLVAQAFGIAIWIAARGVADRSRQRPGWRASADGIAFDCRLAARTMLRQPWSSIAIVVTLAIGMAAPVAVFAVFNHVLFRPIPGVDEPDGLATVYFQPADRHPTFRSAPRAALDALRQTGAFTALGSSSQADLAVVSHPGGDAGFVRVEFVTPGYLDALRVRPSAGRLFTADDFSTRRPVAVISEHWWQREFGRDPAAIGRSISINREPVTIVGVLSEYRGWGAVRIGTIDVWMPIDAPTAERAATTTDSVSDFIGRLRPGVSAAIAEQQLRAPFAPFAAETRVQMTIGGGPSDAPAVPVVYPRLYEINEERTRASIADLYPFALGAGALLLLLACANTSNLLLARTMQRVRDLAVRSAMGATRWRLARGQLIEASALVTLAAALAVLLARAFAGAVQGEQIFGSGPALDSISLDWRVFAFVAACGLLTVMLFGLLPALAASRPAMPAATALSNRVSRGSRRLRGALVCVQLALAVTLLAGAGVLVRTLQNLRGIDLGLNPEDVVTFEITPMRLGYTGDRRTALVQDLLDNLRRAPGVMLVAYAAPSPFWRLKVPANLKVAPVAEAAQHEVGTEVVSADYIQTLGIPLRAGRWFTADEAARAPTKESIGVVNESLARQLFGDGPAVGRRIYLSRAARGWELDRTIEIVGVVGDTRFGADLRASGVPVLYQPGQSGFRLAFFIRSRVPPGQALDAVRAAVRHVDPALPLADAGPLSAAIDRLVPEERVLALLVTGIAVLAMILGISGVNALIAHTVAERTREFGIQLALGATRAAVSRGVLRGVAIMAIVGLLCGLALFAGASRLFSSRLYGISPLDPLTLSAVSAVLAIAALGAAWVPARRATRVDPAVALRVE